MKRIHGREICPSSSFTSDNLTKAGDEEQLCTELPYLTLPCQGDLQGATSFLESN